jgi:glyoxylate/hydroxypyruvate reductase A
MNILLTGSWDDDEDQRAWLGALGAVLPGHRLLPDRAAAEAAGVASIEAAIVANPPPGSLQGLPGLRLIQSLWAGVDRLLGDATLPPGVPIARMVDPAMSAAMAETALWAVLSLHRGFFRYAEQQRAGLWRPLAQRRADEVAVLVLGLGEMGRTAAMRLAAQGYRVAGWRRSSGPAMPGLELHEGPQALAAVLPRAQILVNLLPLTPDTRGLLAAPLFNALPEGAAVVNLARGAHLVEADLLAALDGGRLAEAVLDVFSTEPLPAGHRFWTHPRVTLLPHAAAQTDYRSAARVAADNIEALLAGRPLAHRVDPARGY